MFSEYASAGATGVALAALALVYKVVTNHGKHTDAIIKGMKVLLVDDLLATGGTALAAAALIEKLGGIVMEMAFIVDLPDVGGSKKLTENGYKFFALAEFEGD